MFGRLPRPAILVAIVTALWACDNVSWGGASIRLEHPASDSPPGETDDSLRLLAGTEGTDTLSIPAPPFLYAAVRNGDSATLVAVARLDSGRLLPLPTGAEGEAVARPLLERALPVGAALALFDRGTRVGTLRIDTVAAVDTSYCPPRAVARGHVELLPSAMAAETFLALDDASVLAPSFGSYQAPASTRTQRVASLNLASQAITSTGAPWPRSPLLDLRQDLQLVQLTEEGELALIATFANRDRAEIGPAPESAYALLILGERSGGTHVLSYARYRPVGGEGKGVPRFFSHADWDADGTQEVLLTVFGESRRWWASLDRTVEGWELAFEDACGVPEESTGGG